jgi:plastocyanin
MVHSKNPKLITAVLIGLVFISILLVVTLGVYTTQKEIKPQKLASVSIMITSDGFEPATLAVEKGTRIIWTNSDTRPHQLQANPHPTGKSLPSLRSEILNNKQTFHYMANETGSFGYHDHLNPTINGNLDVKE